MQKEMTITGISPMKYLLHETNSCVHGTCRKASFKNREKRCTYCIEINIIK